MTETEDVLLESVNVTTPAEPKRPPMMTTFAAKLGLPPIQSPRISFDKFIQYWRKLNSAQRVRISVYVYRLFPVIRRDDKEGHYIACLPGESPIGGETATPEEDVLARWGLGNYMFQMNCSTERGSSPVCKSWLLGWKERLPGFTSFKEHPPIISNMREVVIDDPLNKDSGYLSFLRGIGELPGSAVQESESDMAEHQATATAVGVLGDIAKDAFRAHREQPQASTQPATGPEWETIQKTIETVNDIHVKNATPNVDPVAMFKSMAEVLKPPPPPEPPEPPDLKPFLDQNAKMTETIIGLHAGRADDLREELRELRKMLLEQNRTPLTVTPAGTPAVPRDPLESLLDTAKRFNELKEALGVTSGDDEPPRRRRQDDTDLDPENNPDAQSTWLSLLNNGPAILGGLTGLLSAGAIALHNARVMQTGQGETVVPPMPSVGGGATPNPTGSALLTNPADNPTGTGLGPTPMNIEQAMAHFLTQIEYGLLRSMEARETGYEYAETFINSIGRSGTFGYETLKTSNTVPQLNPRGLPFPEGSIEAVAVVLRRHGPIWTRIGADPRLPEFLRQFVTYDDFLAEWAGEDGRPYRNLTELLVAYEVATVQEFLDLPEEKEEPEGTTPGATGTVVPPVPTPKTDAKERTQRSPKVARG